MGQNILDNAVFYLFDMCGPLFVQLLLMQLVAQNMDIPGNRQVYAGRLEDTE